MQKKETRTALIMQKRNTLHLDEKKVKTHISVMQNSKHSAYYAKKGTHTALMMKKKGKHTALILQKRTRTKPNMQKITGTKLIMQKRNTQSAYYANWYYLFLGGT